MAAIGRGAAVVQMLGGKTMKGKTAQLAWGTVHLALLPTNEDRAKAVVDWAGAGLTHQRSGRITVDLRGGAGLGGSAMSEALFEELGRRGHEPLLEKVSGTIRFEIVDGKQTERWLVSIDKGDLSVSRKNVRADCTLRTDKAVFDRVASGKMNAMAATLRGDIALEGDSELLVPFQRLLPGPPRRRRTAPRHRCRPTSMSDGLIKILDGNTFVVSDTRGDIEASLTDPTGLFSFDTRFLSKWVLTRERRAAESALGRRSPVLRDAVLPRARNRHRLRRREALGDPPARGRERLPRGADDPEPRREAGRPRRSASTPAATSPTCSR